LQKRGEVNLGSDFFYVLQINVRIKTRVCRITDSQVLSTAAKALATIPSTGREELGLGAILLGFI
jgi:hypothetical protein